MKDSWKIAAQLPNLDNSTPELTNQLIIETLLKSRDVEDVQTFLNIPKIDHDFLQHIQDLFPKELAQATSLIQKAIDNNQSIVIHGDYDVDGVSATAILWEKIYYDLGYRNCIPFIPHRVDHGYGLTTESIDEIINTLGSSGKDPGLLITVDCGITSITAVDYAVSRGFEVIVTDHHTLPENENDLPKAAAILHTTKLCGAGISWALSTSLDPTLKTSLNNHNYLHPSGVSTNQSDQNSAVNSSGLDLVALATLADIQDLTEFNRVLVYHGLQQLTLTNRPGLQSLYKLAEINGKTIGPYEVGWVIAPRLNATGRLEHALDALRLLVAHNPQQAEKIAHNLNELNYQRQQITFRAVEQAAGLVAQSWTGDSAIIVSHPDWHEGVIGLIAARLVEKFAAPVIAVSENGEFAKGSARSLNGINIVELLRQHQDLMKSVGGHAMAAGFSIASDQLPKLKERVSQQKLDLSPNKEIKVDLELPAELVTWDLHQDLEKLQPFGVGNPRPVFVSSKLLISDMRTVGKEADHLKLTFKNTSGVLFNAIGFGLGDQIAQYSLNDVVDIVHTLDKDDFRGNQSIQLKVKDISRAEA